MILTANEKPASHLQQSKNPVSLPREERLRILNAMSNIREALHMKAR